MFALNDVAKALQLQGRLQEPVAQNSKLSLKREASANVLIRVNTRFTD